MFTFDQVFDQIKQIATDKPDNIADCIYRGRNDEPVCIVGHWLDQNNLLYDDEWDEMEDNNVDFVLDWLARNRGVSVDAPSRKFLTLVQGIQDRQTPWGEALDAAIAAMEQDSTQD
jgi:hypothetical protein